MQLSWPAPALFSRPALASLSPIPCLHNSSTLETLVACFDNYTVPYDFYTAETYAEAQPLADQLHDWTTLIDSVLSVDGSCSSIPIPPSIAEIYSLSLFSDTSGPGAQYCVLSELYSLDGAYARGWGLFVVPATAQGVQRDVHLAAPHPQYDLFTPEQAGALFKAVGARSLLIAGRQRTAYALPSDCVVPTSNITVYYKTDPAHDTDEPFFPASLAIHAWQETHGGGCPAASCAFIQLHGKSASTCPTDTAFLSAGLGRDPASREWYTSPTSQPVKRLKPALIDAFASVNSSFTFSLPSDSSCSLVATDNVFGRFLNGVPAADVCTQSASAERAKGEFVHVEQAIVLREPGGEGIYEAWAQALKEAFPLL
ncbi:hypothetical protein HMN09_01182800 [Mycena chlorophos]|uniref:Uncharacterized protein n=1 Tax=Mycena chlorophos TaxID=658473 RepID=A0A8H6VTZ5_MYCCL|nr:hypothetical protein HMN09_01182800 [Mycena chlorophos]